MSEKIKVMIVDDHPMVRKGLAMFVKGINDLEPVGEAAHETEAISMYERTLPDVTLVDMVLKNSSGASLIRKVREKYPEAVFIALTSYGEEKIIEEAIQAGARGFLYKDVHVDALANAIRQTHQGQMIFDAKASDVILNMLDSSRAIQPEMMSKELSAREYEVLNLLVDGLTNKQIAAVLGLQTSTIKQYISKILQKLHVHSRTEAVAVALRDGLIEQRSK